MKKTGKNSAVGQTAEDIITPGGTFTEPTEARIHTVASTDTQDDAGGVLQVETATVVGTIVGIDQVETQTIVGTIAGTNQVETATVVGTIGVAGAGDASVIITSALVTGSPLEVAVAVANDDTASQVATKIRAALNSTAAVTDHYTIGGSDALVSLTTKVNAENDESLNIAIDNDTCTGLTAAPTSADTTEGHPGAGDASVIITSALVTGSPLEIPVAVANGDTASQVATKIKAALNLVSAITTHYTIGGSGADIILTTKVKAANDGTLNLAFDNDTCLGLTGDTSSVNTTAGHAGTGNAAVVVTGALIEDSPITLAVPVVAGDTPTLVAGKIRSIILLENKIASLYNVGGTGAAVTLTKKVQAANDTTLNISIDNDTCNGLTQATSSADTTAGLAGTGARKVKFVGPNELDREITEIVELNGTASVTMKNKFKFFNEAEVENAGLGGVNAGTIEATAGTDNTVSARIEAGKNAMQYATHYTTRKGKIKNFFASANNSTAGAQTTIELLTKKAGGVWKPKMSFDLNSSIPTLFDKEGNLFEEMDENTMFKFQAVASAGSSSVIINFEF